MTTENTNVNVENAEGTVKLVIENERQLYKAIIKTVPFEAVAQINVAIQEVFAIRLGSFANKNGKVDMDKLAKSSFRIDNVLNEALRNLEFNKRKAAAHHLEQFLADFKVTGLFYFKDFRFAAVSTVDIDEDTFEETTDGRLVTKPGKVGFDVVPVSLFTQELLHFLGKLHNTVQYRYVTFKEDGKKVTKAVYDPKGAHTAIDMRRMHVTTYMTDVECLSIAQRATKQGFYCLVEGQSLVDAQFQYRTTSQARKGGWVAGELTDSNDKVTHINEFLKYKNLSLANFASQSEDGNWYSIDVLKAGGRAPLLTSSGQVLTRVTKEMEELKVNVVTENLTILENDKGFKMAIIEDVKIKSLVGKYYALVANDGRTIKVLNAKDYPIEQVINDGLTIVDAEFHRLFISPEVGYAHQGEGSFRIDTGVIKGMIVPSPLEDGFTMITIKGNVKALAALKHGSVVSPEMSYLIKKDGKNSFEVTSRKVSHQLLATNNIAKKAMIEQYNLNMQSHKEAYTNPNAALFRKMFGNAIESQDAVQLETLYNTVLKALNSMPESMDHPYISYGMKKMLEFYIDGLKEGKLYIESNFKLLAYDIELTKFIWMDAIRGELAGREVEYTITEESDVIKRYIAAGNEVIKAGNVVTSSLNGKGCYKGDVTVNRYPLTHFLHSVKVKAVQHDGYKNSIYKGLYRSLIQFSIFDALLISLAGADCDGDMAQVTYGGETVESYNNGDNTYSIDMPRILDKYVRLNDAGEIIEIGDGVPYKESNALELDFELPEGFEFDKKNAFKVNIRTDVFETMSMDDIEDVLFKISVAITAVTLLPSDIGRVTNGIMAMNQTAEDLRSRAAENNRVIVDLYGNPVAEYPEVMGTTMDASGNFVSLSFVDWANQQADIIEKDALGAQWFLQYELDKAKHGGMFAKAMKDIADAIFNPTNEGRRILLGVAQNGAPVWAVDKKGNFLMNKPSWLTTENDRKKLREAGSFQQADRLMATNIERVRYLANNKAPQAGTQVILDKMDNIADFGNKFVHYEENAVEYNALRGALVQVYSNYNQVVSGAVLAYNEAIAYAYTQDQKDDLENERTSIINNAIEMATADILVLERKFAFALQDSAKSILSIVYDLVHNPNKVEANKDKFKVSGNEYDLIQGFAFFWSACMPQLAKANDNALYKFYTDNVEKAITMNPQRFNTDQLVFVLGQQGFGINTPISDALRTFPKYVVDRFTPGVGTGNPFEFFAQRRSMTHDKKDYVTEDGTVVTTKSAVYNGYDLFVIGKEGNYVYVGVMQGDSIHLLNNANTAKITIDNASFKNKANKVSDFVQTFNPVIDILS